MFTIGEYKIVFSRRWHERGTDINGKYVYGNGRYDTVCEIYTQCTTTLTKRSIYREKPSFTGVAKLHPNDQVDRIVGKKLALQRAIGGGPERYNCSDFYRKSVRTVIWKAFFEWVANWKHWKDEEGLMRRKNFNVSTMKYEPNRK
jgi:hypothetical protein